MAYGLGRAGNSGNEVLELKMAEGGMGRKDVRAGQEKLQQSKTRLHYKLLSLAEGYGGLYNVPRDLLLLVEPDLKERLCEALRQGKGTELPAPPAGPNGGLQLTKIVEVKLDGEMFHARYNEEASGSSGPYWYYGPAPKDHLAPELPELLVNHEREDKAKAKAKDNKDTCPDLDVLHAIMARSKDVPDLDVQLPPKLAERLFEKLLEVAERHGAINELGTVDMSKLRARSGESVVVMLDGVVHYGVLCNDSRATTFNKDMSPNGWAWSTEEPKFEDKEQHNPERWNLQDLLKDGKQKKAAPKDEYEAVQENIKNWKPEPEGPTGMAGGSPR